MNWRAPWGAEGAEDGGARALEVAQGRAFDTPFRRLWETVLTWQAATFTALVVCGLLAVGLVKLSLARQVMVHVVEVDRLGRVVYSGPVHEAIGDDRIVRYELSEFIVDLRTVVADRRALYRNRKRALIHVRAAAVRDFLDAHFNAVENDLVAISRSRHREVNVQSLLKVSESSWRVEWSERDLSLGSGKEVERTSWTGIIGVELDGFTSDANPGGLFVSQLEWTRVSQSR